MTFLEKLADGLRDQQRVVVFPEGAEARILAAADRLVQARVARVILLGSPAAVEAAGGAAGVSLARMEVVDPEGSDRLEAYARGYADRRPRTRRGVIDRLMAKPMFFGGAMVSHGDADAMVAGIATATARVIEAGLMTVGLAEGIRTPSSAFMMLVPAPGGRGERPLLFADCALNLEPSAAQLADIAVASADSFERLTGEVARVALLSFSTRGSGRHASVDKVREAVELARARAPGVAIDGELQADAALVPRVAALKVSGAGAVAGRANVLIFPNLDAGNIAYKLTEHLAGAAALGPLLQGLARPVSDLSRGATVEAIAATVILTLAGTGRARNPPGSG